MAINLDAAMTYLRFVEARHQVWEARQKGLPAPWTDEPLVAAYKFTNVFRILDHGTQFVMTDLVDPELSPRDQLLRLFLYRHTGRVETWEYLTVAGDGYPTLASLDVTLAAWKEYRGQGTTVLKPPRREGQTGPGNGFQKTNFTRPVFTSAYLVFPQSQERGTDKLDSILDLTRRLFDPASPQDIVPDFIHAQTQAERFAVLRRNRGVADFMSMQVLTDWGYTPHCGEDRENEFVVLGPGAVRGAKALDPSGDVNRTLLWAVDALRSSQSCPEIPTPSGDLRAPSYMDAQNTLCEFSKHVRFASKPALQRAYTPAHPGPQTSPVLPEHW